MNAALIDVREEELAARDFVVKELIPFLGQSFDVSAALQWRLSEYAAVMEGDSTASNANLPEATIRLSSDPAFRNMLQRRRYLASFALISSHKLTRLNAQIKAELSK